MEERSEDFWVDFANYLEKLIGEDFVCHLSMDDFDGCLHSMSRSGDAFARTGWTSRSEGSVIFDCLSVSESDRKKGIATKLLNAHIKAADNFGLNSWLWVTKNTWQHEWYKRKGYQDEFDYSEKVGDIWMCRLTTKENGNT